MFNKHGYSVYPVNSNEVGNTILCMKYYLDLNDIKEEIDMVHIFRTREAVFGSH